MQGQLIFTMTRSRDHIALVRFSYFFSGVSPMGVKCSYEAVWRFFCCLDAWKKLL